MVTDRHIDVRNVNKIRDCDKEEMDSVIKNMESMLCGDSCSIDKDEEVEDVSLNVSRSNGGVSDEND
nr:hypothetical protein [Tanacetum cinerariifolium]